MDILGIFLYHFFNFQEIDFIWHQIEKSFRDLTRLATHDNNQMDGICMKVERLLSIVLRLPQNEYTIEIEHEATKFIKNFENRRFQEEHDRKVDMILVELSKKPGRPRIYIGQDHLEFLTLHGFKVKAIAEMLLVSERTVKRRLKDFGLSTQTIYTGISDNDLDLLVLTKLNKFPNTGYKSMKGLLKVDGVVVTEIRLRDSIRRVDPLGVMIRSLTRLPIIRRKYSVPGPLSLFHIDGNHKLIA